MIALITLITEAMLSIVFYLYGESRQLWDDEAFFLLAVAAHQSQAWVSAARAMPPRSSEVLCSVTCSTVDTLSRDRTEFGREGSRAGQARQGISNLQLPLSLQCRASRPKNLDWTMSDKGEMPGADGEGGRALRSAVRPLSTRCCACKPLLVFISASLAGGETKQSSVS